MTSVWFVTPAWQRYELTAVCLDQRVRVIAALAEQGIEGRCVVVADDANLDLARERGFDTVARDNEWLGRRFNDGIEYAARHGADWIVPIGSDSFIDPSYLLPLPLVSQARTAQQYAVVAAERMAVLRVRNRSGAGPYMLHRSLLERSGFRPAADFVVRHVDASTIAGIVRSNAQPVPWRWHGTHELQYIGFRGHPHITSYSRLMAKWGVSESTDPWPALARVYDPGLVDRARAVLSSALVAA